MSRRDAMEKLGREIGEAFAAGLECARLDGLARKIAAALFGVCRACGAPLSGPSPRQVCAPCDVADALARGLGGAPPGDA